MKRVTFLIVSMVLVGLVWAIPTWGVKTVSEAGTEETLVASSTPARWVIIQADLDNTNNVYICGDSDCSNAHTELDAGESVRFDQRDLVDGLDLVDIYLDVDTSGEGVHYWYAPGD